MTVRRECGNTDGERDGDGDEPFLPTRDPNSKWKEAGVRAITLLPALWIFRQLQKRRALPNKKEGKSVFPSYLDHMVSISYNKTPGPGEREGGRDSMGELITIPKKLRIYM